MYSCKRLKRTNDKHLTREIFCAQLFELRKCYSSSIDYYSANLINGVLQNTYAMHVERANLFRVQFSCSDKILWNQISIFNKIAQINIRSNLCLAISVFFLLVPFSSSLLLSPVLSPISFENYLISISIYKSNANISTTGFWLVHFLHTRPSMRFKCVKVHYPSSFNCGHGDFPSLWFSCVFCLNQANTSRFCT